MRFSVNDKLCLHGNRDLIARLSVFVVPFGGNRAVASIDRSKQRTDALVRQRRYANFGKTGTVLGNLNAAGLAVDPIADRSVGIVVEGVHVFAPNVTIFVDAVPMFPHGGSPEAYRE